LGLDAVRGHRFHRGAVIDGATIVVYSQDDAYGFGAADGQRLWTVPGSYQTVGVANPMAIPSSLSEMFGERSVGPRNTV
jgi:hypothetical protein